MAASTFPLTWAESTDSFEALEGRMKYPTSRAKVHLADDYAAKKVPAAPAESSANMASFEKRRAYRYCPCSPLAYPVLSDFLASLADHAGWQYRLELVALDSEFQRSYSDH